MYLVNKNTDINMVEIIRDNDGDIVTPFQAYLKAKLMRRLWMEQENIKVKILIDKQILTLLQTEVWSHEESKRLPKCKACASLLKEDVYVHQLCESNLFCTQVCADKDYLNEFKRMNDEDESDCF